MKMCIDLTCHSSEKWPIRVNAFGPNPSANQIAVGLSDGSIHIIDIDNMKDINVIEGIIYKGFRRSLTYSKNGKVFVVSGYLEKSVRIYSCPNYELLFSIPVDIGVEAQASPDGKYLAVSINKQPITIWDLSTQKIITKTQIDKKYYGWIARMFGVHEMYFQNLQFSDDNKYLMANLPGYLFIWNMDGTLFRRYKFPFKYNIINLYLLENTSN